MCERESGLSTRAITASQLARRSRFNFTVCDKTEMKYVYAKICDVANGLRKRVMRSYEPRRMFTLATHSNQSYATTIWRHSRTQQQISWSSLLCARGILWFRAIAYILMNGLRVWKWKKYKKKQASNDRYSGCGARLNVISLSFEGITLLLHWRRWRSRLTHSLVVWSNDRTIDRNFIRVRFHSGSNLMEQLVTFFQVSKNISQKLIIWNSFSSR